jgi:hypothetical protein
MLIRRKTHERKTVRKLHLNDARAGVVAVAVVVVVAKAGANLR